jgi:hypothetical protein
MAKPITTDVSIDGIDFTVTYWLTPEQKAIIDGPWENAQEGFPAEIEIEKVVILDYDITDILNEKTLISIESKIEEMASEPI